MYILQLEISNILFAEFILYKSVQFRMYNFAYKTRFLIISQCRTARNVIHEIDRSSQSTNVLFTNANSKITIAKLLQTTIFHSDVRAKFTLFSISIRFTNVYPNAYYLPRDYVFRSRVASI